MTPGHGSRPRLSWARSAFAGTITFMNIMACWGYQDKTGMGKKDRIGISIGLLVFISCRQPVSWCCLLVPEVHILINCSAGLNYISLKVFRPMAAKVLPVLCSAAGIFLGMRRGIMDDISSKRPGLHALWVHSSERKEDGCEKPACKLRNKFNVSAASGMSRTYIDHHRHRIGGTSTWNPH